MIVVRGAVQIGTASIDEVGAILTAIGPTILIPAMLAIGIGLVGRLQRAGQHGIFA